MEEIIGAANTEVHLGPYLNNQKALALPRDYEVL
jgi:hypothetical protein